MFLIENIKGRRDKYNVTYKGKLIGYVLKLPSAGWHATSFANTGRALSCVDGFRDKLSAASFIFNTYYIVTEDKDGVIFTLELDKG